MFTALGKLTMDYGQYVYFIGVFSTEELATKAGEAWKVADLDGDPDERTCKVIFSPLDQSCEFHIGGYCE